MTNPPVAHDLPAPAEDLGSATEVGQEAQGELRPAQAAGSGAEGVSALSPLEPSPDPELARLKELLFKREMALLNQLAQNHDDVRYNVRKVSEVVAEAIMLREGKDDGFLRTALEQPVDAIFKDAFYKHQHDLVNMLFPLMGPSIRKSIAQTFRSMLESFSKSLEMAFSWKGLRWRLEAIRSGKPFSEIVLLHTLVYRVEQMFFIHSETGLVLTHLVNEGVGSQDADMVSAMLTAIQDFVNDCFAGGSQGGLESLNIGDFTILIEKTPIAYLACVVRGNPPSSFPEQLAVTLELMLVEYADKLAAFDGDAAPFAVAARYLEPYMVAHYADEDKKLPWWAKALPVLLLLCLLGALGYYKYNSYKLETQRLEFNAAMENSLNILKEEPGLMVADVRPGATEWAVTLLKDDLAPWPAELLARQGLDSGPFVFKIIPYISYDPSLVLKRVEQQVSIPDSVRMEFSQDGLLTLYGTAPMGWIARAREEMRSIAGVKQVNIDNLHDPRTDQIKSMVQEVEAVSIEFPSGKDTPVKEDQLRLEQTVDTLVELEKLANSVGLSVSLTIYGHADATGAERRNYEVSQNRARTVAAMLYARGSGMPIALYGMGSQHPKTKDQAIAPAEKTARPGEDQASRRIELKVHLVPSAVGSVMDLVMPAQIGSGN